MKGKCEKCNHSGRVLLTLYKEYLCEDCWDRYLASSKGKVEYFVDAANEIYPLSEYDPDFLGEGAVSWNKHKHELDLSDKNIKEIEIKAISLGLL